MKPIESNIIKRQLSGLCHLHKMNDERLTTEVFKARVHGRNKIGRPRLNWVDQVRQGVKERGIHRSEAKTSTGQKSLEKEDPQKHGAMYLLHLSSCIEVQS